MAILTASRRLRSCSCRLSSARLAAARSLADGVPGEALPCGDDLTSSTARPNIWSNGCLLRNISHNSIGLMTKSHQMDDFSVSFEYIIYRSISSRFFCCSCCRFSTASLWLRCFISCCSSNFWRSAFSLALFLNCWNESMVGVGFGLLDVGVLCGEPAAANDDHEL